MLKKLHIWCLLIVALSLPIDIHFLFFLATSDKTEYMRIINNSSPHQLHSLIKVVVTSGNIQEGYLINFPRNINIVKMMLCSQYINIQRAVNVAFILVFALQLANIIDDENL